MEERLNQNFEHQLASPDDSIDIKRYLSLYFSNWYWFAVTLFVALTIAYGINRYSEKIYTVSSTLLIRDEHIDGSMSGKDSFMPGVDIFKSQQNLKNEMGILKSFSLNLRVVDSLPEFDVTYVEIGRRNIVERRLYKDCPFIVISDSIAYQPWGIQFSVKIVSEASFLIQISGDKQKGEEINFGKKFGAKGFNFTLKLRDPDRFEFDESKTNKFLFSFSNPQSLANLYRSKLNISPIEKDASIVTLSLSGASVAQEADYLNKIMELYIKQGIEFKNRTADSTIKFIEQQLNLISNSLVDAETRLQDFKGTNRIINISTEGAIIQSKLERFENERVSLELQDKYYSYLFEYLNSKNESGDLISPSLMGVTDQMLGDLVKQLVSLQQQKKQLAMNLSVDLPPLALLQENINNLRERLIENVRSGQGNIKRSVSEISGQISLVNEELKKLPGTERQMINFQRTYDLNNTVYTYLLEKKSEAQIAKASNVSDNRIIDMAQSINAVLVKPQVRKNYAMAWGLGFLIPAILIFFIDLLNNKIIDRRDVEKGTMTPVIGYISHNISKNEVPVAEKPGSILAESFRSIRTSLKYFLEGNENPVIAITSTISSEGKTFISINLAAITAQLGKKVLLIGLDLRKPRIHKVFDMPNTMGMSNYLSNGCEYDEVIQKTPIENLFYASSGPVAPNPAELIENERLKEFIIKAKKEYDIIIIDTPPIAIVTDTLLLRDYVDMNIFVIRQRYSSKNTLNLIQELYQSGKLKKMGIVINDISLSGYYGYGLSYGYYMGYGYSYGNNYYGGNSYKKYGYSEKGKGYYSEEN